MDNQPVSFWRSARRWLPGLLISVIAFALVLRVIRLEDLKAGFAAFGPLYIGLAAVLTVIFLMVRGMASRSLLENKVSFRQAFLTINVGYLLNNIFPLRAGELGRAVLLGQTSHLGPMHVLSTIVIERAFDLAIAAGLLLSTLPLALGMAWARPVAMVTLALVVAMLVGLFMMARYQSKVHTWAGWLGQRIPLVNRFVIPQLDALLRGLSVLVKPRQFLISFGWIALSWLVAVAEYYVMIYALNPRAPFWWGAFVDAVLALGIAVPSAPGALGVFEAAMVGALSLLGFSASVGLAYAVILHFMQWVITAAFGVYGLMREGRSLSSFVSDISKRVMSRGASQEISE